MIVIGITAHSSCEVYFVRNLDSFFKLSNAKMLCSGVFENVKKNGEMY